MISYKLAHDMEDFQPLPIMRRVGPPTDVTYPQLYTAPRNLTYQKYQHLQELKRTVPQFFHSYYDELPHESKNRHEPNDEANKQSVCFTEPN